MKPLLSTTDLGLKPTKKGKVRDIFDLGDKLFIVATDRISAFDIILPDPIPKKGIVLTQITYFWAELLKDIIETHLLPLNINYLPEEFKKHFEILKLRSMLCKKTTVLPVECIVRGYLSGSGFKEYYKTGSVCGIKLPSGLLESQQLPEPIFTPSTKADVGHDENISFNEVVKIIGKEKARFIKQKSIELYQKAAKFALTKGIIIADTKFEFGYDEKNNKIILIDEFLTPDSSRFWPTDKYEIGNSQPSFDKQFVRDYLETLSWDKKSPAPKLPQEVIETTSKKYCEIYSLLTGKEI